MTNAKLLFLTLIMSFLILGLTTYDHYIQNVSSSNQSASKTSSEILNAD